MTGTPPTRITSWLRASRAEETQERLAQDIERVTGWRITRDRYSKYESGSLPIGPKVLRHFVDYWASRGVAGPDDYHPMAAVGSDATVSPTVAALLDELRVYASLVDRLIRQNDALMRGRENDPTSDPPPLRPDLVRAAAESASGPNRGGVQTEPASL